MNKAYTRINWQNEPSVSTPINETNLNKMDYSLNEIDNRVVNFDTSKANESDMLLAFKSISFDSTTGVFTFTKFNNTTVTVDTVLEKVVTNFDYDDDPTSAHYQQLVITLEDGTTKYVDLSALITQYEFTDTSTIAFTLGNDGKITANVIDGSITPSKLQPNFLADCVAAKNAAELAQSGAESSASDAEAYAVGTRNGIDVPTTDPAYHKNAKYFSDNFVGKFTDIQWEQIENII